MTNFNERMNTTLYKNISLSLYSRKGWYWFCVRVELESASCSFAGILSPTGTETDWYCNSPKPSVALSYIIVWHPPVSSTHLPPSPNSTMSTGQGDIPISSIGCTCFAVLPLIYTSASLDWRLGWGSICYRTAYCSITQSQMGLCDAAICLLVKNLYSWR